MIARPTETDTEIQLDDDELFWLTHNPGYETCECCGEPVVMSWEKIERKVAAFEDFWSKAPENLRTADTRRRLDKAILAMFAARLEKNSVQTSLLRDLKHSLDRVGQGEAVPLFDAEDVAQTLTHRKLIIAGAAAVLELASQTMRGRHLDAWADRISAELSRAGFNSPNEGRRRTVGPYTPRAIRGWRNDCNDGANADKVVAFSLWLLHFEAKGLGPDEALGMLSRICREKFSPVVLENGRLGISKKKGQTFSIN